MLPKLKIQNESTRQTPSSNHVGAADNVRGKFMAAPGNCGDRGWRPLGIGHLVTRQGPHNAEGGTAQVALTAVSVVSPKQTAPAEEIILPGNVQRHYLADIRTHDGYLRKWYADIGAPRQARPTACLIELPEVDSNWSNRSAISTPKNESRACGDHQNRYQGLLKSNAVAAARCG